ncbi:peptidylprolyl isomerase [Rhodospirillales bacterium]|nr:peptidylprolyl isomerase [Rhodospirillales bacterium]
MKISSSCVCTIIKTNLLVSCALALLSFAFAFSAIGQSSLNIVAIVNDEIISDYDLQSRIDFVLFSSGLPNNPNERKRIRNRILNNLIDQKLMLQQAKRQKIKVSRKQIGAFIGQVEKQNRMLKGDMAKLLNKSNIDTLTYERQVEAKIAWGRIIRKKLAKSGELDEENINAQIRLIRDYKGRPEYLVAEIFISFDTGKSDLKEQELVNRLYQQIKGGTPFGQVARSFSESASAARNGNLGWIREDQLDPYLAKIILTLQRNELSVPVKAPDGYYILLLKNKRLAQGLISGETSVSIQQILLPLKNNAAKSELQAQLTLAQSISRSVQNCKDMEALEKEIGIPKMGKIQEVKLSNLLPSIRKATRNLDIGKASNPIRTKAGILILMVCSRTFDEDEEKARRRVAQNISQRKAELISRRELLDLRLSAFIETRK